MWTLSQTSAISIVSGARTFVVERIRSRWWTQVMLLWLASTTLIIAVALLGAIALTATRGWGEGVECCFRPPSDAAIKVETVLARWDAGYYLRIVRRGYNPEGEERAFFPLYPYMVRALAQVSGLDIFTSSLVVSSLAYLGAGLTLYRVAWHHYGHRLALLTALGFFFFPTSFFFVSVYAESLVLFLSIVAYWLALRGNFVLSGLFIALASTARPMGWLLAVPYGLEFLRQRNFGVRRVLEAGLGLLIGAAGTVLVLTVLIPFESHGWKFWQGYAELTDVGWKAYLAWPWVTLYDAVLAVLFGADINPDWFSRAISVVNLAFALFILLAGALLLFKLPLSLAAFMLAASFFFLAVHGPHGYALDTLPRHTLYVFPLYLFPALVLYARSARWWRWWMVASLVGLCLLTAWYASGRWVA